MCRPSFKVRPVHLVMESDLNALSVLNLIFKYADDTNLLVPENTDVSLSVEYDHCNSGLI